jgi:ribosomal protein L27
MYIIMEFLVKFGPQTVFLDLETNFLFYCVEDFEHRVGRGLNLESADNSKRLGFSHYDSDFKRDFEICVGFRGSIFHAGIEVARYSMRTVCNTDKAFVIYKDYCLVN